jgi:hypothetical protein
MVQPYFGHIVMAATKICLLKLFTCPFNHVLDTHWTEGVTKKKMEYLPNKLSKIPSKNKCCIFLSELQKQHFFYLNANFL